MMVVVHYNIGLVVHTSSHLKCVTILHKRGHPSLESVVLSVHDKQKAHNNKVTVVKCSIITTDLVIMVEGNDKYNFLRLHSIKYRIVNIFYTENSRNILIS